MNTDMIMLATDEASSSILDSDRLLAENMESVSDLQIDDQEDSQPDFDSYYDSETGEKHPGHHTNKNNVLLD